ncbi:hypothetical protein K437DRAFT_272016 [Tilletiaria anomala UBC 951]|uniref:Uncharacterized protein n=1 Tax=Tilletiaria anomala (strain ATCC 24038 / CBS 436.72 / UBC 951) TaxID=1037660 RepID=A0A066WG69_TILAU|nr:uncharacterized protein K437DRAFT_272016 [Tilletiaria anomala UBC 951]KDN52962.1 hypothetical protein K437DRAFT_272016 [Tilletiaria anomala UBC 951]
MGAKAGNGNSLAMDNSQAGRERNQDSPQHPCPIQFNGASHNITGSMSRSKNFHAGEASRSLGGMRRRESGQPLGGLIDQMALLASPSRGLDDASASIFLDGQSKVSSLMNADTQNEFRQYISDRIKAHRQKHGLLPHGQRLSYVSSVNPHCQQSLEEVALLVRKLREALMATHRVDSLTLEIYMLSVLLSLLCDNAGQFATAMPRLVEELLILEAAQLTHTASQRLWCDVSNLTDDAGLPEDNLFDFFASLYLLSRTVDLCIPSAKGKERASDFMLLSLRLESLARAQKGRRSSPRNDMAASLLHRVKLISTHLRTGDVLSFRRLIIQSQMKSGVDPELTPWHYFLLRKVLIQLQTRTWTRLKSSYHSLTLPWYVSSEGAVAGAGVSFDEEREPAWLEKLLLTDAELDPIVCAQPSGPISASPSEVSAVRVLSERLVLVLHKQGLPTSIAGGSNAAAADSKPYPRHPHASSLAPWRLRMNAVKTAVPTPPCLASEAVVGGVVASLQVRG